jgi:hypothetical protein
MSDQQKNLLILIKEASNQIEIIAGDTNYIGKWLPQMRNYSDSIFLSQKDMKVIGCHLTLPEFNNIIIERI